VDLDVHPRISLNLISAMRWSIDQQLEFIQSAGIRAISLTTSQLGGRPEEVFGKIRAAGLQVVSLGSGGVSLIDSESTTLAGLTPLIEAAKALNSPVAFFVSGPSPARMPTDEAFDRLVSTLGPAIAYAQSGSVRLTIEHSSPATRANGFVHSLADAIDLSCETGVGIAVELQNCWYERKLAGMLSDHVNRFMIVQYSDFLVGEELRLNRRVPGDGSMPLEWMIGQLLDAGYEGYFDLEMLGPSIEAEGYASAIGRGIQWLSQRLMSWGV
jgi:sugar phosphate isomerase/epimerase